MEEQPFYSQKWNLATVQANYVKFDIQIHDVIENQGVEGDSESTIEILEWLYDKTGTIDSYFSFPAAAQAKQLPIMKWLKDKNVPFGHALLRAVECGDMEQIKWLLDNGCDRDECTFECAAPNRQVMQFLFENGFRPNSRAMANTAQKGTLEDMKWLQSLGCPIDESSIVSVIGFFSRTDLDSDNLQKIQWLLDQGFPTSLALSQMAATRGDLTLLKMLKANKCKFNQTTFKRAVERDKTENVEWLIQIKCPRHKDVAKFAKSDAMRRLLNQQ